MGAVYSTPDATKEDPIIPPSNESKPNHGNQDRYEQTVEQATETVHARPVEEYNPLVARGSGIQNLSAEKQSAKEQVESKRPTFSALDFNAPLRLPALESAAQEEYLRNRALST